MLMNLNMLRAFAALFVVYYHTTSEAGLNLPISIGTRGVDVFFVISGFIITKAALSNPEQFLTRRLIRIVPFYWAATLAIFAIAWLLPNLLNQTKADFTQLLFSLFFIPRETSYAGMFPTLILGWSLNYEMYFYVMFALALLASEKHAPIICGILVASVLVAINVSGATQPSLTFYARPIVFEFVFGIIAFYVVVWILSNHRRLPRRRTGLMLAGAVILASLLLLGVGEYERGFGLSREISAGVPAFFLVTSVILVELLYGVSIKNRTVFLIGESSYILYLIHPYIIYGLLRTVFRDANEFNAIATVALIAALLAVASGIAVAIHLHFEKPIMDTLRRHLLRPRRHDVDKLEQASG